jgi:hypothetical protein
VLLQATAGLDTSGTLRLHRQRTEAPFSVKSALLDQRLSLQYSVFKAMQRQVLSKLFLHRRFVIGPVVEVYLGN